MSVLHFEMCQKLRKAFADWQREAEREAEQARRTNEQMKYVAGYAQRHPIKPTGSEAA